MKRFYPAAERNADAILEVLTRVLPKAGLVLEVASGPGQHALHMARGLTHLTWQPTDVDPGAIDSIAAYRDEGEQDNLAAPLILDASTEPWPVSACDGIVCINMIHIAPWSATLGLFAGAAPRLALGAPLVLYGPFSIDGDYTSQSNADFDQSLRERDSEWGVRELRNIEEVAMAAGFELDEVVPRPANNHVVVFRRV